MLKAGFRKCHRRPQHRLPLGCELRVARSNTNPPHLPRIPTKCRDNGNCTVCSWLKLATNDSASCKTRFTRGRVREFKNGHSSVTVQNRTHVYVNFFHHKDPGNHLLLLCPKVVKHPVSDVLTVATLRSTALWEAKLWPSSDETHLLPPLKQWHPATRLHGVTSETALFAISFRLLSEQNQVQYPCQRTDGLFEKLNHSDFYEGWNFNSGNYLFTTDTK